MSEHDPSTPVEPTSSVPPASASVPSTDPTVPPTDPGPPVPRGVDDPATRRNWASAAHWTALAAALLGGFAFLGPLVVWLIKRDQDRWVAAHAVESLNFQLTWLLGGFVAGIAGFVVTVLTVGIALVVLIPLALAAAIAWVVLTIRGAVAASRAEDYRYPLTVRMITV